jgi:predicted Zn-dependent protease
VKKEIVAVGALLALTGCARNPASGKRELMLVSEAQEIQMGREAARQIPDELGLLPEGEIAAFVRDRGFSIARASERPHLPWEFHVVDSSVVNAFALPGGFVYLTRGILAHMNSEAEMVGVLGHEIGHVTARHSAQQLTRAQLTQMGLGLGMVFVPEVRPFGDLLQGSLGLLFLKFGRDDESEADRLGVRYSLAERYDPREMAGFFGVLARLGERSGEAIPAWLSTHPDPLDREAKIETLVELTAPSDIRLEVGEESFKRMLQGMVFGEDPREGFLDGAVFKHPDLEFQIAFPEDWRVTNTRRRLLAGSKEAAFEMTAARTGASADPRAHAARVFQRAGLEAGASRSLRIGGFPAFVAEFRQVSASGAIYGEAAFLLDRELMYELFAYTSLDRLSRMAGTFRRIFSSFARLTDPGDLAVQPQRITLYRTPRGTSARQALLESGVPEAQLEELAIANHLLLSDRVEAGALLKSVTPSTVPARVSRKPRQNREKHGSVAESEDVPVPVDPVESEGRGEEEGVMDPAPPREDAAPENDPEQRGQDQKEDGGEVGQEQGRGQAPRNPVEQLFSCRGDDREGGA